MSMVPKSSEKPVTSALVRLPFGTTAASANAMTPDTASPTSSPTSGQGVGVQVPL